MLRCKFGLCRPKGGQPNLHGVADILRVLQSFCPIPFAEPAATAVEYELLGRFRQTRLNLSWLEEHDQDKLDASGDVRRRRLQLSGDFDLEPSTSLRTMVAFDTEQIQAGTDRSGFEIGMGGLRQLDNNDRLLFDLKHRQFDADSQSNYLNVELHKTLANERLVHVKFRAVEGTFHSEAVVGVDYRIPLKVPLRMSPLRGAVKGRLILPSDMEPGQILVSLAENEFLVDESGVFSALGLDPGSYELNVPAASVPLGIRAATDLPIRIDVVAGKTVRVEIPFERVALLTGRVQYEGVDEQAVAPVAEAVLVLRGKDYARRATSGSDGSFTFSDLSPGSYQLVVVAAPEVAEATPDKEVSTVVIEAGQEAKVEIRLARHKPEVEISTQIVTELE